MRLLPWLALVFIIGACSRSSDQRYLDAPGQHRFPLTADGRYGFGMWEHPKGQAYTVSVGLYLVRGGPAHLEAVRPIGRSDNLDLLGVLAAGPDRGLVQAGGAHGFPPADLPDWAKTWYRPIAQVPVTARKVHGMEGTDVLIGIRLRSGHRGWIDGIEVTYTVGGQRYVGRFPVSAGLCDFHPCPVPDFGPPWDGRP